MGCGWSLTASRLAAAGAEVVGVDLEIPAIVVVSDGVLLLRGDYLELCSTRGQFDWVVALDAIEHFEDEGSVLSALAASTRPGGKAVITVPVFDWLWTSYDDQNRHFRRFTSRRLCHVLENGGFEVNRAGYPFPGLVLPKLWTVLSEGVSSKPRPAGAGVVGLINRLGRAYFATEARAGQVFPNFWPFGTSVVAVETRRRD